MHRTILLFSSISLLFGVDYVACDPGAQFDKTVKLYYNMIGEKPDHQIWFKVSIGEDDPAKFERHGDMWSELIVSDTKDGAGSRSSLSGNYANNVITIKDQIGSIGLISLETKSGEIVLRSGHRILFFVEDNKSPN